MSPATENTDRISRVPPQLPSLSGLRFLGALAVFAYHAATVFTYPNEDAARDVNFVTGKLGMLGLCCFFVMSGFVITWSAKPRDRARSFWRRRLLRIYPNHLVTFAVTLAVLAVLSQPITGALPNLLLVHAWFPDPEVFNSVNVVSWSLAVEALFYALFPALYRVLVKIPHARLWWCASAVALAIVCMPFLAEAIMPAAEGRALQEGQNLLQVWFVMIFPPVVLLQIVLGMLMARIVLTGRWIGFPLPLAAICLVACYVLSLYVPYNFGISAMTIIPVALLIAGCAVADTRQTRTFLRNPVVVRLGDLTYAFYLVHYVVLLHGRGLFGIPSGGIGFEFAVLGAEFLVTLVLSWLLYTGVETPVMRRWSRPRTRAVPSPPQDPPQQPPRNPPRNEPRRPPRNPPRHEPRNPPGQPQDPQGQPRDPQQHRRPGPPAVPNPPPGRPPQAQRYPPVRPKPPVGRYPDARPTSKPPRW